jgi:pyrimidine oxygenase
MQVGVFVPIGNNGWLISENSPQYMPTFDLNKEIAIRAEKYGLDFLLSMIKLRGFGGKTEFWEHNLESFTLMAGLAAVTEKIKIYATCATLVGFQGRLLPDGRLPGPPSSQGRHEDHLRRQFR